MKIAVVAPGRLPVPAVKGGAVESLIDVFLKYSKNSQDEFWVFSGSENMSREFENGKIHYFQLKRLPVKNNIYNKIIRHYFPLNDDNEYLEYIIGTLKDIKIDCIVVENRPLFVKKIKDALKVPVYLHMHNDALVGKKERLKLLKNVRKFWQ